MQFFLNGFRAGDPDLLPAVSDVRSSGELPERVDVLIVGCGPAGLTLAAQLSAFPDITTCIVERKSGPLELGQADGVACRTMEMFNAFGFAERLLREAYWVNETTFWRPDQTDDHRIVRSGRILDTEPGLSEFPHVILNQARVHEFYLDIMRKSASRLEPHYRRRLLDLRLDPENDEYPVIARLEHTSCNGLTRTETLRARYAIGCDGARSAVRQSIGQTLKGDSAHQTWGVMDVLAVTDFPDIRLKCVINSAEQGSLVVIPREGGYLVRIYVEMDELQHGQRLSRNEVTIDDVIEAARRVFQPYSFEVKEVAWWSVYEIGQRVCDRFDNLSADAPAEAVPRIFIAGDACHTHSPKAGQGMNVSMQDAFNLGWKLAAVLRGWSAPSLLRSYHDERRPIAKELIEFDREWAAMLSAPLKSPENPDGVDPADVEEHFVRSGRYMAGTATRYSQSRLIFEPTHQSLAAGFPIGMRFHSAPVIRLADAKPMQLGHAAVADGRWRLYAFAGKNDGEAGGRIARLCEFLAAAPASPIVRTAEPGCDVDAKIDVRAIFQQSHREMRFEALPRLLRPLKGKFGLIDYEKAFCASVESEPERTRDIFELRGIDREQGALVVVRPDQFVANVLPLDDFKAISGMFEPVLLSYSNRSSRI